MTESNNDYYIKSNGCLSREDKLKILEEFKSYKNQVLMVKTCTDSFYVLKIYHTPQKKIRSLVEAVNLKRLKLKGINVPKVFYKSSPNDSDDYLVLEYVPGKTISHLLEELNGGELGNFLGFKECLKCLGRWMAALHEIQEGKNCFLKGDCNLRNFIWNGSEIYGLDFEETWKGDPRVDLGEICFFLLSNSPPLTPLRLDLINCFLKSYESFAGTKISNISDFIAKSASDAYKRRLKFNRF